MASPPSMEVPSHRACAHCRSQKVRCIPENGNPDLCQRCARSGRSCVFTPLQKRKQRKRTDTRVAELEREMRAMRAALKSKQQGTETQTKDAPPPPPAGLWYEENVADAPRVDRDAFVERPKEDNIGTEGIVFGQAQTSRMSPWPKSSFSSNPVQDGNDVVDRGVLTMATARQLLDTYRNDLYPHYPIVAIPKSVTADELRQTKPTLFLAVIAAASGKQNSELSALLDQEILRTYATRSLLQSEKSLALVQALLISALWYHPPSKYGQLKYYEYIHMAVTMAMDIGIGSRPVQHRSRFDDKGNGRDVMRRSLVHPAEDAANPDLSMTPRSRESSPDTANIESRRTFLGCYMISAGVSLSLRRPNILRVSSYVRESVEYMERSREALPNDRMLVAWVKLVMIAEEISNSFAYDDPGGIASITELRVQLMVRDYDKRLKDWYNHVSEVDMNGSLTIMYYTVRLYLHEVALHVDHSPEDFRAPYQMGVIHSSDGEEIPTQVLANSIAECITNAHALLNTFLSISVDSLRAMPVFSYVRISFAAFVLAKLSLSASHPGSRIAQVLDRSSLRVESIMDRAILHVREVVGPLRCRVPAIFLALLFKLRQWCLNPEMIDTADLSQTMGQAKQRPHGSQSQPRAMMGIDGPRITEHASSSENSPQTMNARPHVTFGSVTSMTGINDALHGSDSSTSDNTPQSFDTPPYGMAAQMLGTGPQNDVGNASGPNMSLESAGQMQLDEDFLNSLGDMSGFPEGGLTGLDDWIPDDMMNFGNMPDEINWQPTPNPSGSTAF